MSACIGENQLRRSLRVVDYVREVDRVAETEVCCLAIVNDARRHSGRGKRPSRLADSDGVVTGNQVFEKIFAVSVCDSSHGGASGFRKNDRDTSDAGAS